MPLGQALHDTETDTAFTDLSLPLVDEKADLPAIIVTPSSPSSEIDFSIAFLAPPPKPTLYQRVIAALPSLPSVHSYLPSQIRLPPSPFKTSFDEETFAASVSSVSVSSRVRTVILLGILLFVMASHLVLHRLAISHPHLDLDLIHKNTDRATWAVVANVEAGRDVSEPSAVGRYNSHAVWTHAASANSRGAVDGVAGAPETSEANIDHDTTEPLP